jgi:hypothetical protein
VSVRLDVRGIPAVRRFLETQRQGALQLGAARLSIGSGLPYAYGIETGRHPRGKLARRAGGAYYLRGAGREVGPTIPGRIAGSFRRGPGAVRSEIDRIGKDLVAAAKRRAPRVSGDLGDSIRDVVGR